MIQLSKNGVYLLNNREIVNEEEAGRLGLTETKETGRKGTMTYGIIKAHNTVENMENLKLKFDSMTSHDITYVGIIQTARASGMQEFPMPYVLTNCHNSLCAVGGTINEDDHMFALSAAKKYGGIYVPTNMAVIHSYNREMMAGCGKMILGSDSHTRYGALGTLAVGEGGGELAKQLVRRTYDLKMPEVVLVYLEGKPQHGVGPQDVALSIIGKVFRNGYVKNKVMEFAGPGVKHLPLEYRNSIDVMTTETTCWSSIWTTDEETRDYLALHGRLSDYRRMEPESVAYYNGCIHVDLSRVECTIALPMHPSNTFTIRELKENPEEILFKAQTEANRMLEGQGVKLDLLSKLHADGEIHVDQGIVAGCSGGTFDSLMAVTDTLKGRSTGNGVFTLSIYPGSMPTYVELAKNGALADMASAGAIIRESFCGPCFGAGDTPANGELSIRHTTRNFPNREGSKPGDGQMAGVALMDARSIAATAINGGRLTAASELSIPYRKPVYHFDKGIYDNRVLDATGEADPRVVLQFGPNIKDWPKIPELSEDLLLKVVSYIDDEVTTTDELIPSGETSSYRSNPLRLAEFTLSRKDPAYVGRAKEVLEMETNRATEAILSEELQEVYALLESRVQVHPLETVVGSTLFSIKPGDGSAREQAASCQRVLGASANIALEYATKRYRSNCINWGMIPFEIKQPEDVANGDWILVKDVRKALERDCGSMQAYVVRDQNVIELTLGYGTLTRDESRILRDGSLINHYKKSAKESQ